MTKIQWTDQVWNPTVGCSRASAGCENCYAERVAHRGMQDAHRGLTVMGSRGPRWTGEVRLLPERLEEPLRWRKPRRVFVDSMSDLFHSNVPFEFIAATFGIMASTPRHTFQVLTKRPERAREFFRWIETGDLRHPNRATMGCSLAIARVLREAAPKHEGFVRAARGDVAWPLANVWLGTSVENQVTADERIPHLLGCPAAVRWISAEPLLGPVDLAYTMFNGADSFGQMPGLDWVVVGGESGPGARACDVAWIRSIVAQCRVAGVPAFVKQLGAQPVARDRFDMSEEFFRNADANGWDEHQGDVVMRLRDRKGGDPDEWAEEFRVREWPEVARG